MTFGTALRTARQARGMTLADLTARTKIRTEYLEALEAEQLAVLPERVLVRSFVQTYAREVGLDPAPLLADLDTHLPPQPQHLPVDTPGGPLKSSPAAPPARRRAVLPLPTLLAGLLVLGAGGYAWWSGRSAPAKAPAANAQAVEPAPAPRPAPPKTLHLTVNSVPSGARVLLDNRELGQTPLASFPVVGRQNMVLRVEYGDLLPLKQIVDLRRSRNLRVQLQPQGEGPSRLTDVATGTVQDSLPVEATQAQSSASQKGVNLKFTDASWVRVTAQSGAVVYEGILPAGTQRHYDQGVTLRVGNAGAVQVSVDGRPAQKLGESGEAMTRTY